MLPSLLSSYAAHPFGSVVLRRARVRVLSPHYTTRTLEETFLYDTYGRFNQAAEVLPLLRLPLPVVGGATSGVCGVLGGLGCQHRLDAAGLVRAAKVRRSKTEKETEKKSVRVCGLNTTGKKCTSTLPSSLHVLTYSYSLSFSISFSLFSTSFAPSFSRALAPSCPCNHPSHDPRRYV